MTLHRFFISPDLIGDTQINLPEETSHQITQVLRLKKYDQIIVLDNSGTEFVVKLIDINKKHTFGEVIEKRKNENEPDKKIHLYQAIIARDNFELVLQKSVELGVSEVTPIITERTQFDRKFIEGKYERWQRIIKEAAEQSERGILPELHLPLNFEAALTQSKEKGKTLIAWEKEKEVQWTSEYSKKAHDFNIFIGPEGGFTENEINYAKDQKAILISLGKTILRAETAAIASIAKII